MSKWLNVYQGVAQIDRSGTLLPVPGSTSSLPSPACVGFHKHGHCANGAGCTYDHSLSNPTQEQASRISYITRGELMQNAQNFLKAIQNTKGGGGKSSSKPNNTSNQGMSNSGGFDNSGKSGKKGAKGGGKGKTNKGKTSSWGGGTGKGSGGSWNNGGGW